MTKTNPEALKKFMLDNPKDEKLVLSTFRELKPFFKKAEAGVYNFAPASGVSADEVSRVISLATDKEANRVVFISAAHPFPKPEWMTEEAYRNSLRTSLRDSLRTSLGTSLWDSLFYFLGFALAGKKEKVERLTPLIRLLSQAIPLGEKKDEPGTWLVLVA